VLGEQRVVAAATVQQGPLTWMYWPNLEGRQFLIDKVRAVYRTTEDGRWVIRHMCLSGRALLVDGTIGRTERFRFYEPEPDPRASHVPDSPWIDAPEWARRWAAELCPQTVVIKSTA